jgi:hypothetical protein
LLSCPANIRPHPQDYFFQREDEDQSMKVKSGVVYLDFGLGNWVTSNENTFKAEQKHSPFIEKGEKRSSLHYAAMQ